MHCVYLLCIYIYYCKNIDNAHYSANITCNVHVLYNPFMHKRDDTVICDPERHPQNIISHN